MRIALRYRELVSIIKSDISYNALFSMCGKRKHANWHCDFGMIHRSEKSQLDFPYDLMLTLMYVPPVDKWTLLAHHAYGARPLRTGQCIDLDLASQLTLKTRVARLRHGPTF